MIAPALVGSSFPRAVDDVVAAVPLAVKVSDGIWHECAEVGARARSATFDE